MKTIYRTGQFLYAADTKSKPGKMIVDLVQFERLELDMSSALEMDMVKFNALDVARPEVQKLGLLAQAGK